MKTGKTAAVAFSAPAVRALLAPQWSPVVKTGKTVDVKFQWVLTVTTAAAMEPGREDREDYWDTVLSVFRVWPQWSPVVKTGKTDAGSRHRSGRCVRRNGARS